MVDYVEESLNTFVKQEQAVDIPETVAFSISGFDLLGRGDTRAKIIVRLKLEELLSYDGKSSSKYVRRMPVQGAREEWAGFLATGELAASCLCSANHALNELKMLKQLDVLKDRMLVYKNLKVMKKGRYPFSTRIHMWKIHNPLPERIYRLARFKLNREDPAKLLRRFKERVSKYGSFIITRG